jgi:hypothetical protein
MTVGRQLLGPSADAVPPLPGPSLLEAWVLGDPVPLGAGLALVGLAVAWFMGRGKRSGRGLVAGGVLVLLALVVLAAGLLTTTAREQMLRATRALTASIAAVDLAAVEPLLDVHVRVDAPGRLNKALGLSLRGRDEVLGVIERRLRGRYSAQVLEVRAVADGPEVGRSQVRVRGLNPDGSWLGHSWWEIDWYKRPEGWVAAEIEPLWIQGL